MEQAAVSQKSPRQIIEHHYARTPGHPPIADVIPMQEGVFLVQISNGDGKSCGFFVTLKNGVVEELDKKKVLKKKA